MPWRDPKRAGTLTWAYFLISLAFGPVFYATAGGSSAELRRRGLSVAVTAFLAWRVTRGGRISGILLTIGTEIGFLETASGIASRCGVLVFGPPPGLLLTGVLAGLVITVCALGHMNYTLVMSAGVFLALLAARQARVNRAQAE
jgi:hypothetical protein